MKGEMVDEFNRMLQEIRIGVSRKDALRALAERCNVQDISLFAGALIQADQLGVSISRFCGYNLWICEKNVSKELKNKV